jgi:DNA-directed RNA polymerase specialized sigma24 family protein
VTGLSEKMLNEIAAAACRRKNRWRPPTLTAEDLYQEAIIGVLEAERSSKIKLDGIELQRLAELHLTNIIRRETNRREYPTADLVDE